MGDDMIVRLAGVSRVYMQGNIEVRAVDNLDLTIREGEFSALCGPSGSGKTTILNLIGALDAPTSGTVFLEGRDLSALGRGELSRLRRDRIGFVFQAYNLVPVLTAYENAEFVLALQNVPPPERRKRVMAVLEEVGMADYIDRRPDELSGGQQQRVAIARAVVSEPAIVLADEPTANVDTEAADTILDLMERLNRNKGVTFLFSTHDQRVMRRAGRLVRLRDGRLEADEAVP
ncbi:MAG: ABC transporter ATP-binding protein [Desulfobulbaceae bacterium]|jgi:putative ABC transport system ATP-binding protein|nr:ABC transporter ATP-binding protein [Desulfobulbaceae bacterium]